MSTVTIPHEAAPTNERLANLLFDHPGADIILRSQDSYHFRVPKITSITSGGALLGSGEILHCLLTFIFPITQLVPSTPEKIMELLSVAQKYQMGTVLAHIRGSIARHNSLPTRLEPVLHIYALAQKYGLRQEALQTARAIFLKQSMFIEDFDNNLDIMPGASLYELWKYHQSVRAILASDLAEFRRSCAGGTITGLQCTEFSSSQIPSWLDRYIESIGENPSLFDSTKLSTAMAYHVKDKANEPGCKCASIPRYTMREFWEALASVVNGGFDKAERALVLVCEREDPQAQIYSATSSLEPFDVPDANIIIRSSDNVNFRVHKSLLVMTSSFFKDLLSLPQPSDGELLMGSLLFDCLNARSC
ncbi:hypothetical protein BJV77DRAFT_687099 [Russula vinacea]|nr:hypothetical protein BJV77DRAFT_687099 [Russula vinacea]